MPTALRKLSVSDTTRVDALRIIRSHQESAPVKTVPLARDLGLAVFVSSLGEGVSGKIFKDDGGRSESGFVIYLNRAEPKVRQRFTAAHEIAHFILHREEIGDGIIDDVLYRSKLSSPVEAEANRMAADILMPWHLIKAANAAGMTDVEKLAGKFDVSVIAMSIRLGLPT